MLSRKVSQLHVHLHSHTEPRHPEARLISILPFQHVISCSQYLSTITTQKKLNESSLASLICSLGEIEGSLGRSLVRVKRQDSTYVLEYSVGYCQE